MSPSPDDPPSSPPRSRHPPTSSTTTTAPASAMPMPAVLQDTEKRCLHCGATPAKLQRCGGCRRVYFCDRDCQVRVWRQHRPLCSLVPASSASATSPAVAARASAPKVEQPPPTAEHRPPAIQPSSPPSLPSALHTKRATSPKTVRLVTEPVQMLELPASASADDHDQASTTTTSHPKKKKKHKKKKRSNSLHAPASARLVASPDPKSRSMSFSMRKHVVWGDVHAREYLRFPGGGSTVPYDGTWALGLGAPVADVALGSVVAVDELRAQELDARLHELPKSQRARVRAGETRQFDYCRGADNPLFARLSERERKQLFIATRAAAEAQADADAQAVADAAPSQSKRKGSISSSPHLAPRSRRLSRSLSLSLSDTSSNSSEPSEVPDFACVSIEQLDEFAKIRDSRDVACGCDCGDLVRKVARMHVKRLLAFLAEREIVPPAHSSKSELMAIAKAVAASEKNCATARDCECARNGVECHANACDGCVGDCYNPHKAYAYDKRAVATYRKQQIAKWREANASDAIDMSQQQQQSTVRVV